VAAEEIGSPKNITRKSGNESQEARWEWMDEK
jgi:hypothetical protein